MRSTAEEQSYGNGAQILVVSSLPKPKSAPIATPSSGLRTALPSRLRPRGRRHLLPDQQRCVCRHELRQRGLRRPSSRRFEKSASCGSPQNRELADGDASIRGTLNKKFSFGDAPAGHRLDGENYRVLRNGTCFELSTRVAITAFEVYEPGAITRFPDTNRSALQAMLDAMLNSFRFTVSP